MTAPRTHSVESVAEGIRRFFEEFRASFGTDVESELAEIEECRDCQEYPAAYAGRCFRCNADRRLPA